MPSTESSDHQGREAPFGLGQRIIVVGVTCAGKTTLADTLAERLQLPRYEMDSLFWKPGWQPTPREEFRARIDDITRGPAWVLDGNYRETRDLVWARASTLVWLDFGLPIVLFRLLRRTLQRILRKETLWGNNQENWRGAFLSKDSLFLYAFTSQKRMRAGYPETLALPLYSHLHVVRLKSPAQVKRWLASLPTGKPSSGILIRS